MGTGPLSLIQWSLSTRDKLGTGPLSLTQWSLSTRDKLGTGPLYTVEPRQVGGGSFVPLYIIQWGLSTLEGQVEDLMGPLSLVQWSLSTRDKLRMCPLSLVRMWISGIPLSSFRRVHYQRLHMLFDSQVLSLHAHTHIALSFLSTQ